MKRTNLLTKAFFLVMVLMGSVCSAWGEETTIASWKKQKLEKNIGVKADGGDDSNKGIATLTSSVALSNSGTNAYYANTASKAELTFSALTLSSYENISLSFYSRGSKTSSITVSTSVDGTSYTDLYKIASVTTAEKIYTVSNIPSTAKYIKLVYGASTGSFFFGTPVIKGTFKLNYELTALSNDDEFGTVEVSANEIIATPKEGCRVSKTSPYEVLSGNATVAQNGNVFTVTADADCTIRINFEAIPSHTATFYANGTVFATVNTLEGETVEFPVVEPAHVENYEFKGWASTEVAKQATAPEMVTSATMSTENLEFFAVFAEKNVSEPVATLTQTLEYDTWTYAGSTSKQTAQAGDYRLFGKDAYVVSEDFDLSKLIKVIVYGGTYGGDGNKYLNIGDGTNTWKDVTVSGKSQTGENTFTGGNQLSGIGKLYVTSKSGNGTSEGIRMSKIEIYTMEPQITYTNYCTTLAEDITIGSLGYLTYSSANGLDFSDVAVKAYSVKYENGSAKLTEVETVPAGAGVVLKGAADTYSVKLTDEASAIENNDLKVSDGNVQGDGTVYCLANGSKGVGFYRVATTVKVPADKCYLEIPAQSGEARQFIGFDDETTTAISDYSEQTVQDTPSVYNLRGQRVVQPQKGLYIVNGKKVVK